MKKKKDPVREYLRMIGSRGGKKTAEKLTAAELKERAVKAVQAREKKRALKRASKKAKYAASL